MKPEHFLVIFVIFLSVFFVRVNGNVKTLINSIGKDEFGFEEWPRGITALYPNFVGYTK